MAESIRAILFDMDGVLIDAQEWHFEALNRALADFKYLPISREDHETKYDGLPTREKLAMLGRIQSIPESEFAAINALKQRYTLEIARKECQPVEQRIEILRKLREQGYRLAVCSNARRESVDLFIGQAKLLPFFEFTLSNDDVIRPKPDPEIYNLAMKRMGIRPHETLIVEDQGYGVQAAKASGAFISRIQNISQVTYDHITGEIARIESDL